MTMTMTMTMTTTNEFNVIDETEMETWYCVNEAYVLVVDIVWEGLVCW